MSEAQETPQLSNIETHQAFKPERTHDKTALNVLSLTISSERGLHNRLIRNPYSSEAMQTLSQKLSSASTSDRIHALVLAEPEDEYDNTYHASSSEQKKNKLYKQIDSSADLLVNLSQYIRVNSQTFWEKSPEEIYDELTMATFATQDNHEIGLRYAQSQRRGFRLAIVNFIEELPTIRRYKELLDQADDKGAILKNIVGDTVDGTFTGDITVESLPIGLIFYLGKTDYLKFEGHSSSIEPHSGGMTFLDDSLPDGLRGKVVVMNSDRDTDDIQRTREHEIQHVIFDSYLQDQERLWVESMNDKLENITTHEEYQKLEKILVHSILTLARDELIAYTVADENVFLEKGEIDPFMAAGGHHWQYYMAKVESSLWLQNELTPQQKTIIYNEFRAKLPHYLERILFFREVASRLMWYAKQHGHRLSPQKAEALLQFTPLEHLDRLSYYFGYEPQELNEEVEGRHQEVLENFTNRVDSLSVRSEDENVWTDPQLLQSISIITNLKLYKRETLPTLLKLIENANEKHLLEWSLNAVNFTYYFNMPTMTLEEISAIKQAIGILQTKRTGDDFEEVRDFSDEISHEVDQEIDFIHNPPYSIDFLHALSAINGKPATLSEVDNVIEGINRDNLDLVPILLYVGNSSPSIDAIDIALKGLSNRIEHLTPEMRREAESMLSHIIVQEYDDRRSEKLKSSARELQESLQRIDASFL